MNTKKYLSICFILLFSICLMSCTDEELTKNANAKIGVLKLISLPHLFTCVQWIYFH